MNLRLLVTSAIDHLQCHPGNQQLGQTLHKWGRAWVPRLSIWAKHGSPKKRMEHRKFVSYLSHCHNPFSPSSLLYPNSLSSFKGSEVTTLPGLIIKSYVHIGRISCISRLLCSLISLCGGCLHKSQITYTLATSLTLQYLPNVSNSCVIQHVYVWTYTYRAEWSPSNTAITEDKQIYILVSKFEQIITPLVDGFIIHISCYPPYMLLLIDHLLWNINRGKTDWRLAEWCELT